MASLVPGWRASEEVLRVVIGSVHLLRAWRRAGLLGSLCVGYESESRKQGDEGGHTPQAP